MKFNVDIWDCKDANLEIIDGKGVIINTDDRPGSINSKAITLDFSKHVFLEMKVDEVSDRWGVDLFVLDENGKESKVYVRSNQQNNHTGVRRFDLSYAMMTWYPQWQGTHRCRVNIYAWKKKGDKVVLDYVKIEQTDEEAFDINYSPIHYRPPVGRGNVADVIPFFWEGEYHAFYMLGHPYPVTGFDHVVSKDLIHWKLLPRALEMGKKGDTDEKKLYSGTIIERNDTFYFFYTGLNYDHPNGKQQIMIATSPDLITWTKRPEWTFGGDGKYYYNPAINGPVPEERLDYEPIHSQRMNDPHVWFNDESEEYWMVAGTLDLKRDMKLCLGRFVSKDLIHWEARSPLQATNVMDCPFIFRIGNRWYQLGYFSQYACSDSGLLGPYDIPEHGYLQFDTEFVNVPKAMWDGKRHVLLGDLYESYGYCDSDIRSWSGTMTLPREIYAGENGLLMSRPAPEVTDFFKKAVLDIAGQPLFTLERPEWAYKEGKLVGGTGADGPWRSAKCSFETPPDYMLQCKFTLGAEARLTIAMRQQDGNDASGYNIIFSPRNNEVEFGSKYYRFRRDVHMEAGRPIIFQAFVQRSIIECFVNDAYAFTLRAYDYPKGKLSLTADNGLVTVDGLVVKVPE